MKLHIKTITIATVSALFLSACGGSGKKVVSGTDIKKCSTNTFTVLKKNDKVTALTDDTEIRVTHSEDGAKVACVMRGKAKIN